MTDPFETKFSGTKSETPKNKITNPIHIKETSFLLNFLVSNINFSRLKNHAKLKTKIIQNRKVSIVNFNDNFLTIKAREGIKIK